MADNVDLASVSTEDLVAELHRRPLVVTVFNIEDFRDAVIAEVEDEVDVENLTDEKVDEAARVALLNAKAWKMEDRLAERGNEFISDTIAVASGEDIRAILVSDTPAP